MKHVMLVVKLHNESDKVEKKFRTRMEQEGWSIVEDISDTFQQTFPEEESVRSSVKESVRRVTRALETTNWDAIYAGSSKEPTRMKL